MVATSNVWTEQAKKAAGRTRNLQIGVLAGAVALAAMAPASAQVGLMNGPGLWNYTGVLTPYGYFPPRIPSTWITPNYVVDYPVYAAPQVVYVPVPAPLEPPRPAVAPAQVATITLRGGSAPADVRVKPGTVVTWWNSDNRDYTLVIPESTSSETGGQDARQGWRVPANGNFSLTFYQLGTYDYYRLEKPDQRAHIIVTQ
jgi:plastocyanin